MVTRAAQVRFPVDAGDISIHKTFYIYQPKYSIIIFPIEFRQNVLETKRDIKRLEKRRINLFASF